MIEGVDHDDLMGAEESGEEDKKEVCIQVKLGKEEKTKPSLDRYSFLFVFIQFIQVFIICIYKLSQTHIKGIVEYLQAINSGLRSDTFILLRITRITQHKHCIILQILLVIVADTSVEVPTLLEYRNCRVWYSLFHVFILFSFVYTKYLRQLAPAKKLS